MDWDLGQERPPPRHELESDDEDVGEAPPPAPLHLEGDVPRGAALIVLLGALGAAALGAAAEAAADHWPLHACVRADGERVALIHARGERVTLLVPRPELLRLNELAPLARLVVRELRPKSVAAVQAYAPGLYLGQTQRLGAPLRYMARDGRAPDWLPMPADSSAPWEVPNTVTGLGASFFTEAVYADTPAILLLVPSVRDAPQLSFHTRGAPRQRGFPEELRSISEPEARKRLMRQDTLDPAHLDVVASLLGAKEARAAARAADASLLVAALQMSPGAELGCHRDSVGDGGMYI